MIPFTVSLQLAVGRVVQLKVQLAPQRAAISKKEKKHVSPTVARSGKSHW